MGAPGELMREEYRLAPILDRRVASDQNRRMKPWLRSLIAASLFFNGAIFAAVNPAVDWPQWRGPTGDGIAAPGQNPPTQWSESQNVLWKAPVPGKGHGTPAVVGDRIYLATADPAKGSQSLICFDRASGKVIWEKEAHPAGADPGKHANSSAASTSPACDGEFVYVNFLNGGAVQTTAFTLDGKIAWQQKVCDYVTHQGFASSPIVHERLVLVSADHKGGGAIAGLERNTGKIVWTESRPPVANYTSPSIIRAGGKTQMVMSGCKFVTSLDPLTGKKLWEIEGSTEETVGSAVTDGTRVFTSGGWPKNHTMAVVADGSGTIAWQNNARIYVPSMIAKEGHLYAVMDAGMAVCWKAETGDELWKERLGGDVYASPVMVGNLIYATNLKGTTFVFEATPKSFKLLAQNQLGDEVYSSPIVCGSRVYLRVAKKGDSRQEWLYCLGNTGA